MTLQGLVSQAYPSPEWVVFFEVANSPGGSKRRADAVALGVWPSRGHTLVGFEFKEDRRDWLRERQNPAKADLIASHVDVWYVVAGRKDIVKVEELPEPWGLYVANEGRTRLLTVKPPVPFAERDKTTIRRSFAAAMLRKVGETTVPRVELDRLVEEAVQAALSRTREGYELRVLRETVERQDRILAEFKAITGVDLEGWQGPKKIASAVHAVLHLDAERQLLGHAKQRLEQAAKTMGDALASWPSTSLTGVSDE